MVIVHIFILVCLEGKWEIHDHGGIGACCFLHLVVSTNGWLNEHGSLVAKTGGWIVITDGCHKPLAIQHAEGRLEQKIGGKGDST